MRCSKIIDINLASCKGYHPEVLSRADIGTSEIAMRLAHCALGSATRAVENVVS